MNQIQTAPIVLERGKNRRHTENLVWHQEGAGITVFTGMIQLV